MKKQMFVKAGLFSMAVCLGLMGVGQGAFAKNTAHLSGKEKAAQVKLNKGTRVAKTHVRTIPGKVISFDGVTLMLAKGNKTYTVTTDASTSFVDRKWKAVDKAAIVPGHKVTVKGAVTGTSVVATSVRDIKLPAKMISSTEE